MPIVVVIGLLSLLLLLSLLFFLRGIGSGRSREEHHGRDELQEPVVRVLPGAEGGAAVDIHLSNLAFNHVLHNFTNHTCNILSGTIPNTMFPRFVGCGSLWRHVIAQLVPSVAHFLRL